MTLSELPQSQQTHVLHVLETLLAIAEKDAERAKEIVKRVTTKKVKGTKK